MSLLNSDSWENFVEDICTRSEKEVRWFLGKYDITYDEYNRYRRYLSPAIGRENMIRTMRTRTGHANNRIMFHVQAATGAIQSKQYEKALEHIREIGNEMASLYSDIRMPVMNEMGDYDEGVEEGQGD